MVRRDAEHARRGRGLLDARCAPSASVSASGSFVPLSPRVVINDVHVGARVGPPRERPAGRDLRIVGMGVDREHAARGLSVLRELRSRLLGPGGQSSSSELVERGDRARDPVVVDVLVGHEPDRAGIDRAHAHTGRGHAVDELVGEQLEPRRTRCWCERSAGSTLPRPPLRERVGEACGRARGRRRGGRPSSRARRSRPPRSLPLGASRRRAGAAARGLRRSRRPVRTASIRPARSIPSRGRTSRCRRRPSSSRGDEPVRDRGVPDARAVDVHAQPAVVSEPARAFASPRRRSVRPTSPCTCSRA